MFYSHNNGLHLSVKLIQIKSKIKIKRIWIIKNRIQLLNRQLIIGICFKINRFWIIIKDMLRISLSKIWKNFSIIIRFSSLKIILIDNSKISNNNNNWIMDLNEIINGILKILSQIINFNNIHRIIIILLIINKIVIIMNNNYNNNNNSNNNSNYKILEERNVQ